MLSCIQIYCYLRCDLETSENLSLNPILCTASLTRWSRNFWLLTWIPGYPSENFHHSLLGQVFEVIFDSRKPYYFVWFLEFPKITQNTKRKLDVWRYNEDNLQTTSLLCLQTAKANHRNKYMEEKFHSKKISHSHRVSTKRDATTITIVQESTIFYI
jgi:hypothetical protein